MSKQVAYNAADHIAADSATDALLRPSFSLKNRLGRLLWGIVYMLLFRPSPRTAHNWRAFLLRLFGAKIGANPRIYAGAKIWAPWNLTCDDLVIVGDGAEIYNQAPIHLGSHCIVSQYAYLCGSTHDFNDPAFPLIAYAMHLGPYSWICAKACVGPGVNVGEGAVLGLGAIATRTLEPWSVYAGNPAVKLKDRKKTI